MNRLHVNTGRPYDVIIERGAINRAGELARGVTGARRAAVICDGNVAPLYSGGVCDSLKSAGFEVFKFIFSAGEESKTLETVGAMLRFLAGVGLSRGDVVIALGGGVTGDLAGFAAGIYLRGIDYIGLPTSLLAQIDSSVGGKTGADLPEGKNLCGVFKQPLLVIIDPDTLSTLPPRYFSDGLAEAVKYGCIKSEPLFKRLESEDVNAFMDEMIFECVDVKRGVVERDETESGERMLLNFGHTLGHALEKYYNFATLSHGEAVGVGMVLMARFGEKNGLTEPGTAERIAGVLRRYSLPTSDPAPIEDLLKYAGADKKRSLSGLNIITLKKIGQAEILHLEADRLGDFFGIGG